MKIYYKPTEQPEYLYRTESGQSIAVWIERDCGMVRGQDAFWHKVIARPIGFNNCPHMILDFSTLTPRVI